MPKTTDTRDLKVGDRLDYDTSGITDTITSIDKSDDAEVWRLNFDRRFHDGKVTQEFMWSGSEAGGHAVLMPELTLDPEKLAAILSEARAMRTTGRLECLLYVTGKIAELVAEAGGSAHDFGAAAQSTDGSWGA